jgi:hypothetical protein
MQLTYAWGHRFRSFLEKRFKNMYYWQVILMQVSIDIYLITLLDFAAAYHPGLVQYSVIHSEARAVFV